MNLCENLSGLCFLELNCWVKGHTYTEYHLLLSHCSSEWLYYLYLHQHCIRILLIPHPHQHLVLLTSLKCAIFRGIKWHLIIVLIWILLITVISKHFFIYLLAIWTSILWIDYSYLLHFFLFSTWVFLSISCWFCLSYTSLSSRRP